MENYKMKVGSWLLQFLHRKYSTKWKDLLLK